jgi:hypothetical protein
MKARYFAAFLAAHAAFASARPALPPAGVDALYPAYLTVPGTNRLLVFGGEGADGKANDTIQELTFVRATTSAAWARVGTLAVARREPEIAMFPGTTVVAIVGGRSSQGNALDAIETFDYATGTRALIAANLPAGLVHHQVVACGHAARVLVIGGDGSLTVIGLNTRAPERSTVAPLRDAAGRKVTLKTARTFASAAAVDTENRKLLVAGGETADGAVLSDAEVIDVTAACVAQGLSTSPLPEPRTRGALARSATAQFEAIYYGGSNGESLALASFLFDVEANTWHAGAPLPRGYGRLRPPHAIDDTVIAIAGGDIGPLSGPASSANTWALYFPENGGEWQPGSAPATMHHARVGNALAFLDGTLVTVFGKDTTAVTPFAGLDAPE